MASTLPVQACVKSNAFLVKHLAPPPCLLLFFLLLLSLLLALALLQINDFLTHTFYDSPLLHFLSPLHNSKQGFSFSLLHIQQHYLGSFLPPCPIFILANFIIFTLLFKSFFLSASSSSSSNLSDSSDFAAEKFEYGGASLEDFFLSSPQQHYAFSPDPPEDQYQILHSSTSEEFSYFTNVQSYNKINNKWEKVRYPYISSSIMSGKRPDKVLMTEKAQSTLAVEAVGKVVEKSEAYLQDSRLDGRRNRSGKASAYVSPVSQEVPTNIEPVVGVRTRVSTTPSHPRPPALPAPLQQPPRATPLPLNTSTVSAQRPPSSPKVKKSLQSSGGFSVTATDGRHEASNPILDSEKRAPKHNQPQKKLNLESRMVRSHSDQQLSQRTLSPEDATALTSPSITNRTHVQIGQSLIRSSSTPDTITNSSTSSSTNRPQMQRAQSMRSSRPSDVNASSSQVTRSPSFSELLDGLSDAEANRCFSDFIAHRFALMKEELDVYST